MSAPAASNPLLQTRTASLDELRELAAAGRLYAVIDACDTPAVPAKAAELGEERAVSLYRGSAEEMYWAIAPYLFAVDGALLDWIVAELWTEPWGIFAVADADLEAVRRHFRRFLLVQSPEGEQWYFRFYDPRVLSAYLLGCSAAELKSFYAMVVSFMVVNNSLGIVIMSRNTAKVIIRLRRDYDHHVAQGGASSWAIISPTQASSLSRAVRSEFAHRAYDYLYRENPAIAKTYTRRGLRQMIAWGISAAYRYGITREVDVVHFLEIALALGRGFDRRPEHRVAHELLCTTDLAPTQRISLLFDYLVAVK